MTPRLRATRGSDPITSEAAILYGESNEPLAQIARLAMLRDEAAETAALANLLGRTPFVAAALALACGVAVGITQASLAPLLTWCVLLGGGLVALARAYRRGIASPFELQSLRIFSRDLSAAMLYVGFVWGAGSFLAFPLQSHFIEALAYSAGLSAIVALTLRELPATTCFAMPVSLLGAAASVSGHSVEGVFAAAAILALGLAPIALCYLWGPLARGVRAAHLAEIPSN